MKKVSLILTTYNCKENLVKTLRSIESQDYPEVEIIIKDGMSTDGTVDVICEYQETSKYPVLWKSEQDTGIYDAMNQGYYMCSGDVIVFFNDLFMGSTVISKMIEKMEEINYKTGKNYIGVHADLVYVEGDKVIRTWKMGQGNIYHGWMPGHPTLFLRREIYEKYGLYDSTFKIAADYEFMIRILKDKENQLAYLPEIVVSMYYGGTSSGGLGNYLKSLREGNMALEKNGISNKWFISILRTLRVLMQFVLGK